VQEIDLGQLAGPARFRTDQPGGLTVRRSATVSTVIVLDAGSGEHVPGAHFDPAVVSGFERVVARAVGPVAGFSGVVRERGYRVKQEVVVRAATARHLG
jgi:hypothetical protein